MNDVYSLASNRYRRSALTRNSSRSMSIEERLELFDAATKRQREDLYTRGRTR